MERVLQIYIYNFSIVSMMKNESNNIEINFFIIIIEFIFDVARDTIIFSIKL